MSFVGVFWALEGVRCVCLSVVSGEERRLSGGCVRRCSFFFVVVASLFLPLLCAISRDKVKRIGIQEVGRRKSVSLSFMKPFVGSFCVQRGNCLLNVEGVGINALPVSFPIASMAQVVFS